MADQTKLTSYRTEQEKKSRRVTGARTSFEISAARSNAGITEFWHVIGTAYNASMCVFRCKKEKQNAKTTRLKLGHTQGLLKTEQAASLHMGPPLHLSAYQNRSTYQGLPGTRRRSRRKHTSLRGAGTFPRERTIKRKKSVHLTKLCNTRTDL